MAREDRGRAAAGRVRTLKASGRTDAPQVSVVMPYRNAAATLGEALHSVLDQQGVAVEVLALDDGSEDEGPALVAAFAARDPRVRALSTHGRGLVHALNTGVALATAPFIARMDADDVSLPGRFAAQAALFWEVPSLGVVGAQVEVFSSKPVGEGLSRYVAWQNALLSPEDHARELFIESPLCHPSTMLRAAVLRDVGGYRDVPWPEDYDLWLRLHARGVRMAKVPRVLLRWRFHPGQSTWRHGRYARMQFFDAKAEVLARVLASWARPVWVWGAGPVGKRTARALEPHGIRAAAFVDIDPRKLGRPARGVPIVPVDALVAGEVSVVAAVGALGAREEIRAQLVARGFREGQDFVCAA